MHRHRLTVKLQAASVHQENLRRFLLLRNGDHGFISFIQFPGGYSLRKQILISLYGQTLQIRALYISLFCITDSARLPAFSILLCLLNKEAIQAS